MENNFVLLIFYLFNSHLNKFIDCSIFAYPHFRSLTNIACGRLCWILRTLMPSQLHFVWIVLIRVDSIYTVRAKVQQLCQNNDTFLKWALFRLGALVLFMSLEEMRPHRMEREKQQRDEFFIAFIISLEKQRPGKHNPWLENRKAVLTGWQNMREQYVSPSMYKITQQTHYRLYENNRHSNAAAVSQSNNISGWPVAKKDNSGYLFTPIKKKKKLYLKVTSLT